MIYLLLALQDDLPQLLEKIEDADAAYKIIQHGKKALPALHDYREASKDEKLQKRAKGLIDAILVNVVDEVKASYVKEGGRCGDVSVSKNAPAIGRDSRLISFDVDCMCRALFHDGTMIVGVLERTGESALLCQTTSRAGITLADAKTLAEYLRPVKDEKDAVMWVTTLTGAAGTASALKDGIEVRVRAGRVIKSFRFDTEGKIVSVE